MEDIVDLIATNDTSATDVSDKIKEILYTKSAERIEGLRPEVAASMFSEIEPEIDQETEEPTDGE
tara:strand:- start:719 stop:913 length:195 start_codon:yes stop_codon:yes gene_type:complete